MKAESERKMALAEHIDDLRRRLIRAVAGLAVGVIVAFIFTKSILAMLFYPLAAGSAGQPPSVYYSSLPQAVTTYFTVALVAGCIIASPYILYQLWMFIGAGLYPKERRVLGKFFLPAVGLFLLGVAFFFVLISPLIVRYLMLFGQTAFPTPEVPSWMHWMTRLVEHTGEHGVVTSQPVAEAAGVRPWLSLNDYISFICMVSLVFGLAFEMPLVVILLVRVGILKREKLKKFRKYVFFCIVVLAAIISPTPDVMTMMAMALPMYLLYEVGLALAKPPPPKPSDEIVVSAHEPPS